MIIFVSGTYIISQQQMYKFVISDKVYIACDTSSAPVTLYMPKITQEFMNVLNQEFKDSVSLQFTFVKILYIHY